MRVSLLGPFEVDGGAARPGPRDRVVLEALAINPGTVVRADQLADALWGDAPPESWKKVVHGCILRLRKILGRELIRTMPQGYQLVISSDDVDAQRFSWLVGRGRELLTLGEADRAADCFGDALAL
jgi:DNA-binding SARP family transcriptional activator